MKIDNKIALAAAVASMALALPAMAGNAVSDGQLLAAQCDTCHGPNGQGAKPNPSINGEDTADMLDMLKAFASGDEPTTIMDRHAKGYTEEQLMAIAEYYSKQ